MGLRQNESQNLEKLWSVILQKIQKIPNEFIKNFSI